MFGDAAVEQRMNAFGAFGAPLQDIINAYAYGDGLEPRRAADGDEVARHGDDGCRRPRQ